MQSATALANPNIAFVKYWGDRDPSLHLPANGSISMNLDGLTTRTRVTFDPSLRRDELSIDGKRARRPALHRVTAFLDRVRRMAGLGDFARVVSENNFPVGAGLASSASAFAALGLAASAAAGLHLSEGDLSRLARTGSGSACRSVPGGFVEWQIGNSDEDSFAAALVPPDHWQLADCIAILSREHKSTGSSQGHLLAGSSPLYMARLVQIPRLLEECRAAILGRDFEALAHLTELDCHLMHAVMMTSSPSLVYWLPPSLGVMQAIRDWRDGGIPVCYTLDAGPNVHAICPAEAAVQVSDGLRQIPGVLQVLIAHPGGPARLEIG